ncbi:MAG: aminoacyl-tRNA hydrolase, partial [Candidatus Marinimicrobia bacterium]|nr:aminoacyl-tRNA hydrolase [Candidatus Neomarinimicrobiota bacterium]
SLPDAVRQRLARLAGRRLSSDGVLTIEARRFRTQARNRQDALDRLVALIRRAAEPPKPRVKTTPTKASVRRRLTAKRQRSQIKELRQTPPPDE